MEKVKFSEKYFIDMMWQFQLNIIIHDYNVHDILNIITEKIWMRVLKTIHGNP